MSDGSTKLADSPAIAYVNTALAGALERDALEVRFDCQGGRINVTSVERDPEDATTTTTFTEVLTGELVGAVAERLRHMAEAARCEEVPNDDRWLRYAIDRREWRDLVVRHEQRAGRESFSFENRPAAADLAFRRADYTTAVTLLETMTGREIPAMLELHARLLERGDGTVRDQARANALRRQATVPTSQWCLVGNIVEERPYGPGGAERREGTKHFKGGSRVYCLPPQWGDGYDQIVVVGRHRSNNRYTRKVISSVWVTDWRAKVVYSPTVLYRINRRGAMWQSEVQVKDWVVRLQERASPDQP